MTPEAEPGPVLVDRETRGRVTVRAKRAVGDVASLPARDVCSEGCELLVDVGLVNASAGAYHIAAIATEVDPGQETDSVPGAGERDVQVEALARRTDRACLVILVSRGETLERPEPLRAVEVDPAERVSGARTDVGFWGGVPRLRLLHPRPGPGPGRWFDRDPARLEHRAGPVLHPRYGPVRPASS